MQNAIDATGKVILLYQKTSGDGDAVDMKGGYRMLSVYFVWSGTVTDGVVILQTAEKANPAAWITLKSVDHGDGNVFYQFYGPVEALRASITTPVAGGGNVTVYLRALR